MMMRVDLAGWSLLMIALAMGFSVLHKAAKDTDTKLKLLGNIIGIAILAVCLILAVGDLNMRFKIRRGAMVGPKRPGETIRPKTAPKFTIPALPKAPAALKTEAPPAIPK